MSSLLSTSSSSAEVDTSSLTTSRRWWTFHQPSSVEHSIVIIIILFDILHTFTQLRCGSVHNDIIPCVISHLRWKWDQLDLSWLGLGWCCLADGGAWLVVRKSTSNICSSPASCHWFTVTSINNFCARFDTKTHAEKFCTNSIYKSSVQY